MKRQYLKLRLLFMVACLCCLFSIVSFASDISLNASIPIEFDYRFSGSYSDVFSLPYVLNINDPSDSLSRIRFYLPSDKSENIIFNIIGLSSDNVDSFTSGSGDLSFDYLNVSFSGNILSFTVPSTYSSDVIYIRVKNTFNSNISLDSSITKNNIFTRSSTLLVWFSGLFTQITNFILSNKLTTIFVSLFFVGVVIAFLQRIFNNV